MARVTLTVRDPDIEQSREFSFEAETGACRVIRPERRIADRSDLSMRVEIDGVQEVVPRQELGEEETVETLLGQTLRLEITGAPVFMRPDDLSLPGPREQMENGVCEISDVRRDRTFIVEDGSNTELLRVHVTVNTSARIDHPTAALTLHLPTSAAGMRLTAPALLMTDSAGSSEIVTYAWSDEEPVLGDLVVANSGLRAVEGQAQQQLSQGTSVGLEFGYGETQQSWTAVDTTMGAKYVVIRRYDSTGKNVIGRWVAAFDLRWHTSPTLTHLESMLADIHARSYATHLLRALRGDAAIADGDIRAVVTRALRPGLSMRRELLDELSGA
jgi:hypothetical protein